MKQGIDYRDRFREFNTAGDGKLSRSDFQRMLASVQIRVTPEASVTYENNILLNFETGTVKIDRAI